jgi:AraC-like DNA-binding protein/mannose-6-phosphate isomerase-like protein (cupin superfamily)
VKSEKVKRGKVKKGRMLELPEIHTIGISIWDPVWAVKEHVNTTHEIMHVIDGRLVLHAGNRRFAGKKGDTLIIPSGTKHRDEFPLDTSFKVLHIQFRLGAVPKAGINRKLLALAPAGKTELKETVLRVYSVFQKNGALAPQRAALQLQDLLWQIEELTGSKSRGAAPGKTAALIGQACRYIDNHLQEHIALKDIAQHLKLSEYYLSHLFSRETGFSLSAYITKARMEQAAEILRDPTVRIAEAAYAVGYEDPNYFGKVFRKYFGCSPGAFRAKTQ